MAATPPLPPSIPRAEASAAVATANSAHNPPKLTDAEPSAEQRWIALLQEDEHLSRIEAREAAQRRGGGPGTFAHFVQTLQEIDHVAPPTAMTRGPGRCRKCCG